MRAPIQVFSRGARALNRLSPLTWRQPHARSGARARRFERRRLLASVKLGFSFATATPTPQSARAHVYGGNRRFIACIRGVKRADAAERQSRAAAAELRARSCATICRARVRATASSGGGDGLCTRGEQASGARGEQIAATTDKHKQQAAKTAAGRRRRRRRRRLASR